MEALIFARRTENWGSLRLTPFLNSVRFKIPHGQDIYNRFSDNVRKWMREYSLSYFEYRRRLKEISQENWQRTNLAIISEYTEPTGRILIPCDDDDWFHPDIGRYVLDIFRENENIDVVYWDCWQHDTRSLPEDFRIYKNHLIGSNSYAVRDRVDPECVFNHTKIQEGPNVLKIPTPLSIWTVHPASFYRLMHYPLEINSGNEPRAEIPSFLQWAKLEIDQIWDLSRSLKKVGLKPRTDH